MSSLASAAGSCELAAGDLQALDEVDRPAEQHAVAVVDERVAEGRGEMRLADPGRAEDQDVGALLEPGIAGGEGQDVRLADPRHGGEVEGGERLLGRQAGFEAMPLDPPRDALGELVLDQGGEEPGGGPALLVGTLGEAPARGDARSAGAARPA